MSTLGAMFADDVFATDTTANMGGDMAIFNIGDTHAGKAKLVNAFFSPGSSRRHCPWRPRSVKRLRVLGR